MNVVEKNADGKTLRLCSGSNVVKELSYSWMSSVERNADGNTLRLYSASNVAKKGRTRDVVVALTDEFCQEER